MRGNVGSRSVSDTLPDQGHTITLYANGGDGGDGINGRHGRPGIDGEDGRDGDRGRRGRDGRDGRNGTLSNPNGQNGQDGGPGGPPSPEQFLEHAMQFDADGDGKLSKDELLNMAKNIPGPLTDDRSRVERSSPMGVLREITVANSLTAWRPFQSPTNQFPVKQVPGLSQSS